LLVFSAKLFFGRVHDAEWAAKRHGAMVSQRSLARLLHHSPVILPIPGTSSVEQLEENVKAQNVIHERRGVGGD
jgi:aryl-alcohol dehydrogenase-like predicted oxidoreductase